jgi:RNA polymerase sigma-70 factor, ECF subfamily
VNVRRVVLNEPREDEDTALMLRVKAGDRKSFAILVERHFGGIQRFLYGKVRNGALAEELAQEVFLRVYRSRTTYEPMARFKTWLYQIASHLGSNSRRDNSRFATWESLDEKPTFGRAWQIRDGRPSAEDMLVGDVRLREVRRAVSELPEKQRSAVMMHKFEEMEYRHIAKALGCSEAALKSLMFRAHETLRESLAHLAA